MAARAPATWSTVTSGIGRRGSPSTVTSGTSWGSRSSASPADSTGAITTMPATRCARCRSTAAEMERWSRSRTLPTLTAKPASAAVCSSAASSDAGPYSVVFCATTPITWERPVTSARAARLGR